MPSLARAAELWRSLELRAQIALVASAIAVLATGYFLFSLASKPSYSVVASGLTATEGGDVANSLEGAGITYELRDGGSTVAVQSSDVTQARVQLAAGQPAERRARRLRALRLQVARRDRLRAEGQVPARARRRDRAHDRVGRRRPLGAGAARAARSSRCSSTRARTRARPCCSRAAARSTAPPSRASPGSSPRASRASKSDDVTITDETGTLLWPSATGGAGTSASRLAGRAAVLERRLGADRRDARLDARPQQGLRPRARRPRPRPADDRVGHVRQAGHEAHRHRPTSRRSTARAARLRRPRPARRRTSASPARPPRPAARRSTATRRATRPSASTRPSRARSSCPARCSGSRSRSSSTRACPRRRSPRCRTPCRALAGIDKKRGDTRQPRAHRLRQAGDRRRGQARPARRGRRPARHRQVGRPRARRAALPLLRPPRPQAPRGRGARPRADVAARDHRVACRWPSSKPAASTPTSSTEARRQHVAEQVEEIVRRQPETVANQVTQWMRE